MEPIALPAGKAFDALGIKKTKGFELLRDGEIEAIKIGRATCVTVASMKGFVDRQLTARRMAKAA